MIRKPRALDHLPALRDLLRHPPFGLFADVDGTLADIAPTPEEARVRPACRTALTTLTSTVDLVSVVSGRRAQDARTMVGVQGAVYIGNHGFERWEADRLVPWPGVADWAPLLHRVLAALQVSLHVSGLIIQDKEFTASIHYRTTSDPPGTASRILDLLRSLPEAAELEIAAGRMVVDLRPPLKVDKGVAVAALAQERGLRAALYIGDDVTDADAFRALHALTQRGESAALALGVISDETPQIVLHEADYLLEGPAEVERLLGWLAAEAALRT